MGVCDLYGENSGSISPTEKIEPNSTQQHPIPIREREKIAVYVDRIGRLLTHVGMQCGAVDSPTVPDTLATYRYAVHSALCALGSQLAAWLATNPQPSMIDAMRQSIVPIIRNWSRTGPFFHHSFGKLRGYPGDFETIEIIYNNQPFGEDLPGLILDDYYLHARPAQAVRNRLAFLIEYLADEMRRKAAHHGTPIRLMSLGCGPARELLSLANHHDLVSASEIVCVDIDADALSLVRHRLAPYWQDKATYVHDNVLRMSSTTVEQHERFHLIYAAGLFDYLPQAQAQYVIETCYRLLAPKGTLIIGNFSLETAVDDRVLIEWLLDWRLIYRNERDFQMIFGNTSFGNQGVRFEYEPLRANLFAFVDKS